METDDDSTADIRLSVPHHFVAAVLEVSDHDAFSALYSD